MSMSSTDTQYKVFLLIWADDGENDVDDDGNDADENEDELLCRSVSPSAQAGCPPR